MAGHSPRANMLALARGGVEFVLVGGMAAVLNGAPVDTFDVDIVHSRDPENIARLLQILADLDAVFRMQSERRLRPSASHLAEMGDVNLITRFGPLDCLGSIGRDSTFEDLVKHSAKWEIGQGFQINVLDLETLIALKEEVGGDKDRGHLPTLRRTLEEQRKTR